jgi:hypothetical protein
MSDLTTRLLALAEKAVDEALQLDYGDPEDRYIYRELQELRQLVQQQAEGPALEPRGCPTPGACSCPTSATVPPDLIRALDLAKAALADISDADREPNDDPKWVKVRAAQYLPLIRHSLSRWGQPPYHALPLPTK